MNTQLPDILTPEQAAEYLQVNRETIYRYIREGRLSAYRLGRQYRISRSGIESLLEDARVPPDFPVRIFSDEEIAEFLEADKLDEDTLAIVRAIEAKIASKTPHESD